MSQCVSSYTFSPQHAAYSHTMIDVYIHNTTKYNTCQDRLVATAQQNTMHVILSPLEFFFCVKFYFKINVTLYMFGRLIKVAFWSIGHLVAGWCQEDLALLTDIIKDLRSAKLVPVGIPTPSLYLSTPVPRQKVISTKEWKTYYWVYVAWSEPHPPYVVP